MVGPRDGGGGGLSDFGPRKRQRPRWVAWVIALVVLATIIALWVYLDGESFDASASPAHQHQALVLSSAL